jgi:hypothetical protein
MHLCVFADLAFINEGGVRGGGGGSKPQQFPIHLLKADFRQQYIQHQWTVKLKTFFSFFLFYGI